MWDLPTPQFSSLKRSREEDEEKPKKNERTGRSRAETVMDRARSQLVPASPLKKIDTTSVASSLPTSPTRVLFTLTIPTPTSLVHSHNHSLVYFHSSPSVQFPSSPDVHFYAATSHQRKREEKENKENLQVRRYM